MMGTMDNLTFEEAFQALERVVHELERGTATLDEALKLYAEGTRLAGYCERVLAAAQLEVRQLQQHADGELVEVPFDFE